MKELKINNNYYFEILENKQFEENYIQNIQHLKFYKVKKEKGLLLYVDFGTLEKNTYKNVLKKLLSIKKIMKFLKLNIGVKKDEKIKLGYLLNYDENNKNHIEFISAIKAILYDNKFQRYNYIYDTVCDYLDNFFYGKNLCDFKENQCGEKRGTTSRIGCCHHFKVKWLGPFTKLVPCEHLREDYTCGAKCIGCKLFTCDYLEKKGVKFRIKDILLLDTFFNPVQKYFIKFMVFTPKEKIIKRLMRTGA